jgi:Major Facilitator Superfamily
LPIRFVGVQNPYAALLRVPGGPAFSSAAFVARLPISMLGIGIVLLVSANTTGAHAHHYALAGAVSATFAVSSAAFGPVLSRLIDRYGQAKAAPPQIAAAAVGIVALVWLATHDAPAWTLFPVAAVAGGAYPNVGSMVRARWSKALSGKPELRTAYSLESVLDELIYVLGPPFVTVLAVKVGAGAALLAAVGLLLVGSVLLLVQRATEPAPAGPRPKGSRAAIWLPGMLVVTLVLTALGGVFGSFEVVTVAFAAQRSEPAAAGLILALYSAGSLCAGVVFGARPPRVPLDRQLLVLALALPFSVAAFPFVGQTAALAALAFAAGVVVSPTLISSFQLVETLVPAHQLTEGLTWAVTGIVFGMSISAAVAGRAIDLYATPAAYAVMSVSGVLTALVALAGTRRIRAALADANPARSHSAAG